MMIDLADVKRHLNITGDDDNDLLEAKIAVATSLVENFVGENLAGLDPFPEPLNEAIRQLAAHYYENREAVLVGTSGHQLPLGVFDLVGPFRRHVF